MTGDAARLLDEQQDRVVVAVEADLAHPLHVARRLALAPELARASATSSAPRRVAAVRASASRFIHASVSTSPLAASCAIAGTRPSAFQFTASSQSSCQSFGDVTLLTAHRTSMPRAAIAPSPARSVNSP